MKQEPPYGTHTHGTHCVDSFAHWGHLLRKTLAPLCFTEEGTAVQRFKPLAWGYIARERQSWNLYPDPLDCEPEEDECHVYLLSLSAGTKTDLEPAQSHRRHLPATQGVLSRAKR